MIRRWWSFTFFPLSELYSWVDIEVANATRYFPFTKPAPFGVRHVQYPPHIIPFGTRHLQYPIIIAPISKRHASYNEVESYDPNESLVFDVNPFNREIFE